MFQDFGSADGPLCIYFHGAPGGSADCAWFAEAARSAGVRLAASDRARTAPESAGNGYFEALAAEVDDLARGQPVRLIGFSLGAFVALQVARRSRAAIAGLELVSPAGPLELGDFLGDMAGGPVFRMALRSPVLFRLATRAQGLMARHAPGLVAKMLFAEVPAAEAALARDPGFKADLSAMLSEAYGAGRAGYLRDVLAYVRPWAADLDAVFAPARIWQGDADTWTPPAMASALAARLPRCEDVRWLPGLGHYTTLRRAMPTILSESSTGQASR